MENTISNNKVYLQGTVATEPVKSHEVFGEGFWEMQLSVMRLSNMRDLIPVTVSDVFLKEHKIKVGTPLCIKGQFRSYNKLIDGRSKLMLTVFVREITEPAPIDNPNIIELGGYVCKPPIYRTTPFNREIADVLLAVNRSFNKSDYIPSICWGRNARFAKGVTVGEKVFVHGRIQSREYQKRLDDGTVETRVAYEVSVSRIGKEEIPSQLEDMGKSFFTDIEGDDLLEGLM